MKIEKHSLIHRPFKKVLIANRGEIALRVVRACRDLGLSPQAVYSEADVNSMHVALSDGAYCIGSGPSSESYLRIDKIIHAARELGAEAIHPGYGFLSENAQFAKACYDAGLVWVGPSPESIHAMGDKTIAKRLVSSVGVPCSPGKNEPLASLAELEAVAKDIGFPIILKAAAGGGGRGMKVVRSHQDLKDAFEACQREALSYFASADVFCERFVENPRHVEVQIIGDSKGNIVYLFDRDCTVQRRHQKLFEEAPSSYISEATRREMGEIAARAAAQVGYCNAGTVEFLLESPTKFYFMEMNTRIQVEHPVTEEITGIDLVATQLKVAMGHPLEFKQSDIQIRGWACEARINAEDAFANFRPSPGTISAVRFPSGGGVRVDSHIYSGYRIPEFYDSMIAKLITVGSNREDALHKMHRALGEFEIEGVQTTIPFHQKLVQNKVFRSGEYTTKFLETHTGLLQESHETKQEAAPEPSPELLIATASTVALCSNGGAGLGHQAAAGAAKNAPESGSGQVAQGACATEKSPWSLAQRLEANRRI